MDIGVRQGMAWTETANPKVLGVEGAGHVLTLGDGVTGFSAGDRVAWVYAPGSYAERISEYSAFYLSVTAEAVVSPTLRERLATWSSVALEPLVDAIIAAQAAGAVVSGDALEICGVLVDLLEGANNRVRLSLSDSPDEAECRRLFESRWNIFQTAMRPKSH